MLQHGDTLAHVAGKLRWSSRHSDHGAHVTLRTSDWCCVALVQNERAARSLPPASGTVSDSVCASAAVGGRQHQSSPASGLRLAISFHTSTTIKPCFLASTLFVSFFFYLPLFQPCSSVSLHFSFSLLCSRLLVSSHNFRLREA